MTVYGACGSETERYIEQQRQAKTSLFERGTECCVLQAADTARVQPPVDHRASACHEDVLGEQTYGSSNS